MQLTKAQQAKLDHRRAFKKMFITYQKDPSYWFDMIVKNWNKEAVRVEARKYLKALGWEVRKVGKEKS
tara:strand:- start:5735 stop:5938 length:204 start_codon:yes stop_codon:yes gene_type:complete